MALVQATQFGRVPTAAPKSALDKILEGVQIANGITSTAENVATFGDKIAASKSQRDLGALNLQKAQDDAAGVYGTKELDPTKLTISPTPIDGGSAIQRRNQQGIDTVYVSNRPQTLSPKEQADKDNSSAKTAEEIRHDKAVEGIDLAKSKKDDFNGFDPASLQAVMDGKADPETLISQLPKKDQVKARDEMKKLTDFGSKRAQAIKDFDLANEATKPGFMLSDPRRALSGAQASQLNADIAELNKSLTGRFNVNENNALQAQFNPGRLDTDADRELKRQQFLSFVSQDPDSGTLKQYGLNPSMFPKKGSGGKGLKDLLSGDKQNASGAPKAGSVEDGYVFQGGDPGDSKNWKKQ